MSQEKPNFTLQEWENIPWEPTPYEGVFTRKIKEKPDPSNPNIPLLTVMAVKMEPKAKIPLHRHNRGEGWTETIVLPTGGWIEIHNGNGFEQQMRIKGLFLKTVKAGEIFGLKNMDPFKPLYFFSTMKPGFTGYKEIEEIKN